MHSYNKVRAQREFPFASLPLPSLLISLLTSRQRQRNVHILHLVSLPLLPCLALSHESGDERLKLFLLRVAHRVRIPNGHAGRGALFRSHAVELLHLGPIDRGVATFERPLQLQQSVEQTRFRSEPTSYREKVFAQEESRSATRRLEHDAIRLSLKRQPQPKVVVEEAEDLSRSRVTLVLDRVDQVLAFNLCARGGSEWGERSRA
jgi:hypothetical protein